MYQMKYCMGKILNSFWRYIQITCDQKHKIMNVFQAINEACKSVLAVSVRSVLKQ